MPANPFVGGLELYCLYPGSLSVKWGDSQEGFEEESVHCNHVQRANNVVSSADMLHRGGSCASLSQCYFIVRHSTRSFHFAVCHVSQIINLKFYMLFFFFHFLPTSTLIKLTKARQVLSVWTGPDSLGSKFFSCSWLAESLKR